MSGYYRREKAEYLVGKAWQFARRQALYRDGEVCQACGRRPPEVRRLVVDHKLAVERGGHPYALDNLQVLCSGCNHSKGRMTPEEWAAKLARMGGRPGGRRSGSRVLFGDYGIGSPVRISERRDR
jgi:5-methylcytosine-specific restriction endonuclease McrA